MTGAEQPFVASAASVASVAAERVATAEQIRAITETGKDLCVVAGAGSGKTFVLTERIVGRVVRGGVPLRDVLAITFTEKAAAEMKARLASALERAGRRGARADVDAAAISTIHAFCARLLRDHAVEAGVDPSFAVLDELHADRLMRSALDQFVAASAKDDPDGLEGLAELAGDDPAETLLDLWRRVRETGSAPGEFAMLAAGVPSLDAALGEVRAAVAALLDMQGGGSDAVQRRMTSVEEIAGGLPLPSDDPAAAALAAEPVLLALKKEARRSGRDDEKTAFGAVQDAALAALSVAAEHALVPVRRRVAAALDRLESLYDEAKGRGAELDFTDLERRAAALVESRPDALAAVRARFPEVLIDEFQDVNPLQARLVARIRTPGRSFVVGDPKQSIYGFRGADPDVFRSWIDEGRRGEGSGYGSAVVDLATSFRSRPEILAAVDSAFPAGVGGAGSARLAAGRTWAPARGAVVELFVDESPRAAEGRIRESAWIAGRIASLIADAAPVAAPTQSDPHATRPCEFGDIAILLPKTTGVKSLEAALVLRDIPYAVVKGRGFFHAREITDLAHLLAAVDSPRDDLTFASVLRGPVCGISDDGLFAMCAARSDSDPSLIGVLAGLADDAEVAGLPLPDREQARAFHGWFSALRRRRAFDGIESLVVSALGESALDLVVLGRPNGRQRAANLRKATELARAADRDGRSLAEFVGDLREMREREIREAEAATAACGAVSILTVHASKGLEFPFVFVPGLGDERKATRGGALADPRLGLGLRGRAGQPHDQDPWAFARISESRKAAESREIERLLYVAMTRAADGLFLSAVRTARTAVRPWWDQLNVAWSVRNSLAAGTQEFASGGARVLLIDGSKTDAGSGPAGSSRTWLPRVAADLAAGRVPAIDAPAVARADADLLFAETSRTAPRASGTPYQTTVSALTAFARCPAEYRLRHVLGVPESLDFRIGRATGAFERRADSVEERAPDPRGGDDEEDLSLSARAIGRAVHAALERLVPRFDGDVRAVVETALREETSGAAPSPQDVERLTVWAGGFRDGEFGRAVRQTDRRQVRREQPFLLSVPGEGRDIPGFILRGQMDLVWKGQWGTTVCDYKTSPASEPRADQILQMRLYALAMRGVDGALPRRLSLWSLPAARAIDVSCDERDAAALESGVLREFAVRTGANDFTPRPEPPCRRCAYRATCPSSPDRASV